MMACPSSRSQVVDFVWDSTCSDIFAISNLSDAVTMACTMAVTAEIWQNVIRAHLDLAHMLVPVVVETCGSFGPQIKAFFRELRNRLRSATSDENSYQHLIQIISVAVQHWTVATSDGVLAFCMLTSVLLHFYIYIYS